MNKSTKGGMTAMIMGAPSPSDAMFELLLVRYKADPNKVLRLGVPKSALMLLLQEWAAAGFEDTLLRCKMEPEVVYGNETAVQPGVQA